jgi:hypothetical protein
VVTIGDTNMEKNVYWVNYCKWIGHTRGLFLMSLVPGRNIREFLEQRRVGLLTCDVSMKFLKPAYFGDAIIGSHRQMGTLLARTRDRVPSGPRQRGGRHGTPESRIPERGHGVLHAHARRDTAGRDGVRGDGGGLRCSTTSTRLCKNACGSSRRSTRGIGMTERRACIG